jgi:sulfoxide reductase heme-binding subunit YedZ
LIKVFSEITKRVYLIIGGVAWLGLAVLAATSTDAMVRRLGGMRWRRLHQAVYLFVLLGLIHHFQQTKTDVAVPTMAAAIFTWLMGYRLLAWWRGSAELSSLVLAGLAVVVSILAFAGEAIGIGLAFNVSPLRVLETAFDIGAGIRPGWQILAAGVVVTMLEFACARWRNDMNMRCGRQPAAAE